MDREIARVHQQIDRHIDAHPNLKEDRELLLCVPGIGPNLAVWIMAELTDVKQFASAQSAAAYAGLQPKENRFGKTEKPTRLAKRGNARLCTALYMPALSAFRHNPLLGDLHARLIERGLKPKAAISAVMRKLLMLAYGVLKNRCRFDPQYASQQLCQAGTR